MVFEEAVHPPTHIVSATPSGDEKVRATVMVQDATGSDNEDAVYPVSEIPCVLCAFCEAPPLTELWLAASPTERMAHQRACRFPRDTSCCSDSLAHKSRSLLQLVSHYTSGYIKACHKPCMIVLCCPDRSCENRQGRAESRSLETRLLRLSGRCRPPVVAHESHSV